MGFAGQCLPTDSNRAIQSQYSTTSMTIVRLMMASRVNLTVSPDDPRVRGSRPDGPCHGRRGGQPASGSGSQGDTDLAGGVPLVLCETVELIGCIIHLPNLTLGLADARPMAVTATAEHAHC